MQGDFGRVVRSSAASGATVAWRARIAHALTGHNVPLPSEVGVLVHNVNTPMSHSDLRAISSLTRKPLGLAEASESCLLATSHDRGRMHTAWVSIDDCSDSDRTGRRAIHAPLWGSCPSLGIGGSGREKCWASFRGSKRRPRRSLSHVEIRGVWGISSNISRYRTHMCNAQLRRCRFFGLVSSSR